jgi:putative inorganic carbon (HCO3(-)) transporter
MRDLVVFLAVLASLPICFRRPYVGLLVFTWLAYMRPQDLCWGFAQTMRFSLYVGITMIAGYLARERGDRRFFKRDTRTTAMVTLLLITYVSTIPARKFDGEIFTGLFEFTKIIAVALFTTGQCDTKERVRGLAWIIAISLGFFGVKGGMHGIATGGSAIHQGPGGMLEDNNDFALGMVMCLPFIFYLGGAEKWKLVRLASFAAVGLTVVTVVLTHSRGGFLALSAVFLFMAWRSGRLFRALLGLGILLTAFVLFAPESVRERYRTIDDVSSGQQDGSVQGRLVSWQIALSMVKHNPLLGVGHKNFQANYQTHAAIVFPGVPIVTRVTHNSYLQIWAENGTIAITLFLVILFSVFFVGRNIRAIAKRHGDMAWAIRYANMIEASMLGFIIGGFFLNRGHFDLTYQVSGLATALYFTVRAHVFRTAAAPAGPAALATVPASASPSPPRSELPAESPRPIWGRPQFGLPGAPRWARPG